MSEYGLKIKNIKAGTLFGYNQGVRTKYDYTDAMFSNSLFSDYIRANGMNVWKEESTRDIICLDFDFGSRTYEEEIEHLTAQFGDFENNTEIDEESKCRIRNIFKHIENNKDNYVKMSKDEIREHFYTNGVSVKYTTKNKDGKIKEQIINYKMLYRNSSKAKVGQVMFINSKLFKKAYDWLTMGIGKKMPKNDAKIVEMSAYAPLTTSTIIDKFYLPVEDILILEDQSSLFKTAVKVVEAEEYMKQTKVIDEEKTETNRLKAIEKGIFLEDGTPKYNRSYKTIQVPTKKCVVKDDTIEVKNTLWDGMALIESSILPSWVNGMALLRHHFFKACAFRTNIQLFFKDWCKENGYDYDTYEISDMFGVSHKIKDIKMITTDNSIKWKKFMSLMGSTNKEAYYYWCDRVNADGSCFGIVKTDHPSKLDDVQQMSYQMVNTLPCKYEDIKELAGISIAYVNELKEDNDKFEQFLRKNANEINHYDMLADLYCHNKDFANSTWFRYEKRQIIKTYVDKLRTGKITINADNLTICGNPYGLLMYTVGENWNDDPTLNVEDGVIQCYTTRFNDGEYLCGIRNPHNSPNNICYLHNKHTDIMKRYFEFSPNILAVNCIHTDVQDRANGCDFDSDFFFVTNNNVMVINAKKAYEEYPTIVNKLKESGLTYNNTWSEYARMDNKFAKSKMGIGESSNLAQLAMTYYWTEKSKKDQDKKKLKDLYDNFVILSVLAQVIIDGCKREYEVDGVEEIKRIKKLPCMQQVVEIMDEKENVIKQNKDFPEFMRYTKKVKHTKNGKELPYEEIKEKKEKILSRINKNFSCPMNDLQKALKGIKNIPSTNTIPTEDFFVKIEGVANHKQMTKIRELAEEYDRNIFLIISSKESQEDKNLKIELENNRVMSALRSIKTKNLKTINRLIETSLGISSGVGVETKEYKQYTKYTRSILKLLYKMDKDNFLSNFVKKNDENSKNFSENICENLQKFQ